MRRLLTLAGLLLVAVSCGEDAVSLETSTTATAATATPTTTSTSTTEESDAPEPPAEDSPVPAGKIAFYSERDGNGEIYVMNADGSAPTRLTDVPAQDLGPTWFRLKVTGITTT